MGVLPDDVRVLLAIVVRSHGLGARKRHLGDTPTEKKYTHRTVCRSTKTGRTVGKLDFDAPETWVWLLQGDAYVPRLMAAPNDLGRSGTPCFRHHDADLSPKWQVCTNDCHTSRMTDIHRDCVCTATHVAFVPFETKWKARHRAFVRAVLCPTVVGEVAGWWFHC